MVPGVEHYSHSYSAYSPHSPHSPLSPMHPLQAAAQLNLQHHQQYMHQQYLHHQRMYIQGGGAPATSPYSKSADSAHGYEDISY